MSSGYQGDFTNKIDVHDQNNSLNDSISSLNNPSPIHPLDLSGNIGIGNQSITNLPNEQFNHQLGGFRTRARAGTLPSRFNSSNTLTFHSGFDFLNNNSTSSLTVPTSSNTVHPSTSNLPINRTSPLLNAVSSDNPTSLGNSGSRDPFNDIFGYNNSSSNSSANTTSPSVNSNLPQVGGGRRLRSGSLFGFDSNIWSSGSNEMSSMLSTANNDSMLEAKPRPLRHHASMQQIGNKSLNQTPQSQPQPMPSQQAAQNLPDFSRIRSYTTSNALSDKQYHLSYESQINMNLGQKSSNKDISSSVSSDPIEYSYEHNQFINESPIKINPNTTNGQQQGINQIVNHAIFSSQLVENSRPRSQTYSIGSNSQQVIDSSNDYYANIVSSHQPHHQYQARKIPQPVQHSSNYAPQISPILSQHQPLLVDNAKVKNIEFTSTFQVSTLSPSNTILLMNLPPLSFGITTAAGIYKLATSFGKVLGVYVFGTHENEGSDNEEKKNNCHTINEDDEYITSNSQSQSPVSANVFSLVEFDKIEVAMRAKAQLNHKELYPNYSCIVGFAKILTNQYASSSSANSKSKVATIISPEISNSNHDTPISHTTASTISKNVSKSPVENERKNLLLTSEPSPFGNILNDLQKILGEFEACFKTCDDPNGAIAHMIKNAAGYVGFDDHYGPLPDPIPVREFDSPKLRETRKLIDSNQLDQFEMESIALAMYDEMADLSSDYLGNTVVQKVFEVCSEEIKDLLLKKISPYIAQMGIHKNGTWAGQKIINVANTNRQKAIIKRAILPYVAPLFKDAFGNYLVQGCLKFGAPYNDFIFEAICSKFWVLAQDRYGSRAIRAVLESGDCTVEQTSLLASLIVVYAEFLAINNNGALLLTWYLDTCSLKDRLVILTKKILPWLVELSYNKLGSLTILKILNNRNHTDAGELILKTLYGDLKFSEDSKESLNSEELSSKVPEILKQILKEFTYGPTFIHKTLSVPLVTENNLKPKIIHQIKRALIDMKVTVYQQGYKRLMDEVGLSGKEGNISMVKNGGNILRTNGNGNFFVNNKHQVRNNGSSINNAVKANSSISMSMNVMNGIPIQLQNVNANHNRFANPLQQIVPSQFAHQNPLDYGFSSQIPVPQQQQHKQSFAANPQTQYNTPQLLQSQQYSTYGLGTSQGQVFDQSGLLNQLDLLNISANSNNNNNNINRNYNPSYDPKIINNYR
ncbi:Jsn1 protein [Saccharomycopsis crataegensis]|uniref:Jsn1 protein n=1 Tax=Saccharomycopsis crataegensis TaxID=43959 RepID=A0AAV5QM65_9ASCO|nr:Jsn1 protein [Saccharomycopsis crataegensis]